MLNISTSGLSDTLTACIKPDTGGHAAILLKVSYAAFKDLLILAAGNVLADIGADTLAVTHFSEDTSVGGGDTLDSVKGRVGVIADIH